MSIFDTALTSFIDRKLSQPYHALTDAAPTAPSLLKGLLAGVIAGLAAVAAQSLAERIYPASPLGGTAGNEPNWGFGAATGAVYGALAEFYPAAANRDGVSFGMTLMALTAESAAPSGNVSQLPLGDGNREQASRIASHVVFGVVAETTRRIVRKAI